MESNPVEERLKALEANQERRSETISVLVNNVGDLIAYSAKTEKRVAALEGFEHARQIIEARIEERGVARETLWKKDISDLLADVAEIKTEMRDGFEAMKGGRSKLLWLFITGLVGAVMVFIVKGGLTPS
jgi:hypothetical protein